MTRKNLAAAAAIALVLAAPLAAQQWQMPHADDAPQDDAAPDAPFSPPGRDPGATTPGNEIDNFMNDLFSRLQPHLEGLTNELSSTMDEFSPALGELSGLMDDIGNYEAPERLPNGDILIRRRADAPPPPPLEELQRLLPQPGTPPQAPPPPALPLDPSVPQTEL